MAEKKDHSGPRRDDKLRRRIESLLLDEDWPPAAPDHEVSRRVDGCSKAVIRMVRERLTFEGRLQGEARSDAPSRGYKPNAVIRTGYVHDGRGGVEPAPRPSRKRRPGVKFSRAEGVVRIDTEGAIEIPIGDYRDWLREQLAAADDRGG